MTNQNNDQSKNRPGQQNQPQNQQKSGQQASQQQGQHGQQSGEASRSSNPDRNNLNKGPDQQALRRRWTVGCPARAGLFFYGQTA